jgi:hypothetical protein
MRNRLSRSRRLVDDQFDLPFPGGEIIQVPGEIWFGANGKVLCVIPHRKDRKETW